MFICQFNKGLKVGDMNIFFVARGWPSKREPQWGCFERDQALALSKLGHKVVMLSVDARFRKYHRKYGITNQVHDGIPHYNIFAGSFWGKPLRSISMRLHTKVKQALILHLFKNAIAQEGMPDLIYGHYLGGCSMALFLKRKYGIPAVGIEHWSRLGFPNIQKAVKNEAVRTYPYLDCQISVSSSLKDNIRRNIGVDTIVVNNMVGNEFHYEQFDKKDNMVRFVTTGNLLPVKGFDNLITAFSRLNLDLDGWELNIVGGGKEHDNLQNLIDRLHLNQNIRLLGRKNREGVIEMLHSSDIYVMSSRSETFGVAAIEALACGLPVIATECGGTADFMNEYNGITCPVDDVKGLANCISYMMNHYQDYDHIKIAEDCQNRFSSEAIGKQLESIFEGIINKKR